jgi:hypothetical protein
MGARYRRASRPGSTPQTIAADQGGGSILAPLSEPISTVEPVTIGPMVPLTTTASSFEARVLAAHLGAEGIVWELRGNVDGPYPVGPVIVLVAEDDLAVAREIVTEQAPDDEPLADGEPDVPAGAAARPSRAIWVLVGLAAVAVATLVGRLLVLSIP